MLGELYVMLGGLEASLVRFDQTASRIAGTVPGREEAADLVVGAMKTAREAQTQVAAIRMTDELVGTVLDVFA